MQEWMNWISGLVQQFSVWWEVSNVRSLFITGSNPVDYVSTVAPYLVPLMLAFLSKRLLAFIATLAIAFYCIGGLYYNLVPDFSLEWRVANYMAGLLVATIFGADALLLSNALHRRGKKLFKLEANLRTVTEKLDREQFWRRASGDQSPNIQDDELATLAQRVQLSMRSPKQRNSDTGT